MLGRAVQMKATLHGVGGDQHFQLRYGCDAARIAVDGQEACRVGITCCRQLPQKYRRVPHLAFKRDVHVSAMRRQRRRHGSQGSQAICLGAGTHSVGKGSGGDLVQVGIINALQLAGITPICGV